MPRLSDVACRNLRPKEEKLVFSEPVRLLLDMLNKRGIVYWLDSGTLLGVMRDGQLIASDVDIDISTWSREEEDVMALLDILKGPGLSVWTRAYRGSVFQALLRPGEKGRSVDLRFFDRGVSVAWAPTASFDVAKRPESYTTTQAYLAGLILYPAHIYWLRVRQTISFSNRPWSVVPLGTWRIPLQHLESLKFLPDIEAWIPEHWEDYLEFRYGDWKIPVRNWSSVRSDRGFSHASPEQLLAEESTLE